MNSVPLQVSLNSESDDEFDEQLLKRVGLSDDDSILDSRRNVLDLTDTEREERLAKQEKESPW